MMRLALYGRTETGPVRKENEDVILVGRMMRDSGDAGMFVCADDGGLLRDGLLAAVADGMGGHAAGAVAARMTMETLVQVFYQAGKDADLWQLEQSLRTAANHANQTVLETGASDPQCEGMGATLAGVALMGGEYIVFHAGDSRVYRLRHGALRLLTVDDTIVALAVRSGRMTPQEAENSPVRHYVTNAAGTPSFELHTEGPQSFRLGDVLMISSDGLHGLVDLETMEQLLSEGGTAEQRCAALLEEAVRRGGTDNISIILIDAVEEEAVSPDG